MKAYSKARFADDEKRMRYTTRSNVNEEADENDTVVTGDRVPSRADRQKFIMRSAHVSPFSRAASTMLEMMDVLPSRAVSSRLLRLVQDRA
jgi:hypothetical protein